MGDLTKVFLCYFLKGVPHVTKTRTKQKKMKNSMWFDNVYTSSQVCTKYKFKDIIAFQYYVYYFWYQIILLYYSLNH